MRWDGSKNERETNCWREKRLPEIQESMFYEVDDRFQFVISRCEVVSNLKNGLKGQEPLHTVLVFAFLQQSSVLAWRIPYTEEPGGATGRRVAKSPTRPSDFAQQHRKRQWAAVLNSLISKSKSATLPATLLRIPNLGIFVSTTDMLVFHMLKSANQWTRKIEGKLSIAPAYSLHTF